MSDIGIALAKMGLTKLVGGMPADMPPLPPWKVPAVKFKGGALAGGGGGGGSASSGAGSADGSAGGGAGGEAALPSQAADGPADPRAQGADAAPSAPEAGPADAQAAPASEAQTETPPAGPAEGPTSSAREGDSPPGADEELMCKMPPEAGGEPSDVLLDKRVGPDEANEHGIRAGYAETVAEKTEDGYRIDGEAAIFDFEGSTDWQWLNPEAALRVGKAEGSAEGGMSLVGAGTKGSASLVGVEQNVGMRVGNDQNNPLLHGNLGYELFSLDAEWDALLGHQDDRTGIALGGSLGANVISGQATAETCVPIPWTDWTACWNYGGDVGVGVGGGAGAHAVYDHGEERFNLGGFLSGKAVGGAGLSANFSLGKEYDSKERKY